MSLELAIQQNTAAINALIEILSKGAIPAAQPVEEQAAEPEAPKAKAKKAPEPEQPAEAPAEEPAKADAAPPTYTETAAFVVEVANKKGRDAAAKILAKFGAKKLGGVKTSRYADVINACKAVL